MYDDGRRVKSSFTIAKEGSTISGLMDAFATAISFNLQYGVPLKFLVDKFAHVRFEPSGWTGNQQIPYAKVHHGLHLPLAGREVPRPRVRRRKSREYQASPHRAEPAAGPAFAARDGRRPALLRVRLDHDAQRKLLQVRELRGNERV